MSARPQTLTEALEKLKYTLPLDKGDPLYVPRTDKLGARLMNRLLSPTATRLLLAGPAGSGKSTELLQIFGQVNSKADVVLCPCDRDLDLYRLDLSVLLRYALWSILHKEDQDLILLGVSDELRREMQARIGLDRANLDSPRRFFTPPGAAHSSLEGISPLLDTWDRLFAELDQQKYALVLILDGLEKVPEDVFTKVVPEFIRMPFLDRCRSVFVIPSWSLYGSSSLLRYPDTEVHQVKVEEGPAFVRAVVQNRSMGAISPGAINLVAKYSGGVVRDGLQIAKLACRLALDEEATVVGPALVEKAVDEIRQDYALLFSDDLERAREFLKQVQQTGIPPANPGLRDRMLAQGAILPREDGGSLFRIHPLVAGPPFVPPARAA